jgi:hypothetical protein
VEERREEPKFDPNELRDNTVAVARWNRKQFEVPDLIGFADYEASSAAVAADLQTYPVAAEQPGLLLPFPYQNPVAVCVGSR